MGNKGVTGEIDPEMRALVHHLNAHLNAKSSLFYQISLLKLKLNSRGSFADPSEKSEGIQKEIENVPGIVKRILEVSERKAIEKRYNHLSPSEFSEIFQRKNEEIENLARIKEEATRGLEDLFQQKQEYESKYSGYANRVKQVKTLTPEKAKLKSKELCNENERLLRIVEELKSKETFLINKRTELIMRRGTRRKNYLGFTIVNKNAMDLKTKYILKQEIIKTIQQTVAEQKENIENIEKKRNDGTEEQEEKLLMRELAANNQKIMDLEWGLRAERDKAPRSRPDGSEFSLNYDSDDQAASDFDDENSLSTLQNMLNGLRDFKQDREALVEENSKLRKTVTDSFLLKGRYSSKLDT